MYRPSRIRPDDLGRIRAAYRLDSDRDRPASSRSDWVHGSFRSDWAAYRRGDRDRRASDVRSAGAESHQRVVHAPSNRGLARSLLSMANVARLIGATSRTYETQPCRYRGQRATSSRRSSSAACSVERPGRSSSRNCSHSASRRSSASRKTETSHRPRTRADEGTAHRTRERPTSRR